jgi:hypothetical protein
MPKRRYLELGDLQVTVETTGKYMCLRIRMTEKNAKKLVARLEKEYIEKKIKPNRKRG